MQPVLNRCQLRALVDSLEVPDCNCDWQPGDLPCCHVLAASHQVPVEDWATLLLLLRPEDYTEPPPPHAPTSVLSHEARLGVYEERHAAGQAIFHPGDVARTPAKLHVAPIAERGRNGADRGEQVIAGIDFEGKRVAAKKARRAA